jgi:hypothetical protein
MITRALLQNLRWDLNDSQNLQMAVGRQAVFREQLEVVPVCNPFK